MDSYEQIAEGMQEKSYNRAQQQCGVKAKELQQANQKGRETNNQSSAKPHTCCFYKELHAIPGRDLTTTPKGTTETSKEPKSQAPAVNSEEEHEELATRESSSQ
ncbi:hypothetical protein UY3_13826 [Chelonia mydas]|uniref:Myb/SANT-like DNA-binding domain-containing protein n=1 Tax=Chelonia mydas TaxID=8469 RepID=M7BLJ5_CHEMY|nr:hypothetical protein UY3_13826 [Chelonia mydas]